MGNIWAPHDLAPHPQSPPRSVERVTVQILGLDQSSLELEWWVFPALDLAQPPEVEPARADGLWSTTCFEAFLKFPGSDGYAEFNFSPSFAWAAYRFDGYRKGMRPLSMKLDPEITKSYPGEHFYLSAEFDQCEYIGKGLVANLTAVIEESSGTKSYWALAHPPEGPPDFHDPACFVLELPPPSTS